MGEDDGDGIGEIFADPAVPWYVTDAFHQASISKLLQRVGQPAPASAPVTFDFQNPPHVLMIANPDNGARQIDAIKRELTGLCPTLEGRFSHAVTDQGSAPPPVGSIVLVYLTEGLFGEDLELLMWLQRCIARDVIVLWVAETDMRHGWMVDSTTDAEHGWRDALSSLTSAQHVSDFSDVALAIRAHDFASVVPYYKDSPFRTVALQLMLQGLGAARYYHTPLHTTNCHILIDFDDLTSLEKISCGAFGEVHCGNWSSGGKTVAVKTARSSTEGSSGRYSSSRSSSDLDFADEIEFSMSTQHPNVVQW